MTPDCLSFFFVHNSLDSDTHVVLWLHSYVLLWKIFSEFGFAADHGKGNNVVFSYLSGKPDIPHNSSFEARGAGVA